jgi:hypothetical protein
MAGVVVLCSVVVWDFSSFNYFFGLDNKGLRFKKFSIMADCSVITHIFFKLFYFNRKIL